MNEDYILIVNNLIKKFGTGLSFEFVTKNILINNETVLDECADFILDLFCKIGLQENYEPNETGILLDKCLEYINEIRYTYHDTLDII